MTDRILFFKVNDFKNDLFEGSDIFLRTNRKINIIDLSHEPTFCPAFVDGTQLIANYGILDRIRVGLTFLATDQIVTEYFDFYTGVFTCAQFNPSDSTKPRVQFVNMNCCFSLRKNAVQYNGTESILATTLGGGCINIDVSLVSVLDTYLGVINATGSCKTTHLENIVGEDGVEAEVPSLIFGELSAYGVSLTRSSGV